MDTKETLEALLDRIDWWGFGFTILVFVAIGGEAATHLLYKQVSKRLQVVLKTEEETRARQLKFADAKAGARYLDLERFAKALKGKPKGIAQIWYKRGDSEAYLFAGQIFRSLGADGAGWDVSKPEPIPIDGRDPDPEIPKDAPDDIRYGSGADITLRSSLINSNKKDTAGAALREALGWGRAGPVGGAAYVAFGDPTLPENHFIIVVGQKK